MPSQKTFVAINGGKVSLFKILNQATDQLIWSVRSTHAALPRARPRNLRAGRSLGVQPELFTQKISSAFSLNGKIHDKTKDPNKGCRVLPTEQKRSERQKLQEQIII